MKPLKITAHLVAGFVSSDRWSPAVDGLMAWRHYKDRSGSDFGCLPESDLSDDPILPLEIVRGSGEWWYAASRPYVTDARRQVRHFHRRFDDQHERHLDLSGKSGKILTAAGPYKNWRRQITVTMTPCISWHVVGDEGAIKDLVDRVTHVGALSAQGHGEIKEWSITDGEDDLARLDRALPVNYAQERGITGIQMPHGLRPPKRLHVVDCIVPNA